MVHQLYFSQKKYLSAHMITVLISYPPNSVLLSIYFHNVCMREVKSHICGGSNPSRLAFAIEIINSLAGSHDRSDIITTNHRMHFPNNINGRP